MSDSIDKPFQLKHVACKDPCEFVMKYGGEAFQRIINKAVPIVDYRFAQLVKDCKTDSITARADAVKSFVAFLADRQIESIRLGQILLRLSTLSGLSVSTLRQMAAPKPFAISAAGPARQGGREIAERWLLGCILVKPQIYAVLRDEMSIDLFSALKDVAAELIGAWEHSEDLDALTLAQLLSDLDTRHASLIIELERHIDEWASPHVSPQIAAMVHRSNADRGITIEGIALDMIATLQRPDQKFGWANFKMGGAT